MIVNFSQALTNTCNTTIQRNMEKPVSHPGEYANDLLADLSTAWIDDTAEKKSPFFLAINPVNPHSNYDWNNGKPRWTDPVPADRHKDEFQDAIVPLDTNNSNPDSVDALSARVVAWVSSLHFRTAEWC